MTRQELSQLYYLEREISQMQQRIFELETAAKRATSQIKVTPGGSARPDVVGSAASHIVDMREILERNMERLYCERKRLAEYITELDDSFIRQSLYLRFMERKSWVQVAMAVGGGNTADGVKKACYRFLSR